MGTFRTRRQTQSMAYCEVVYPRVFPSVSPVDEVAAQTQHAGGGNAPSVQLNTLDRLQYLDLQSACARFNNWDGNARVLEFNAFQVTLLANLRWMNLSGLSIQFLVMSDLPCLERVRLFSVQINSIDARANSKLDGVQTIEIQEAKIPNSALLDLAHATPGVSSVKFEDIFDLDGATLTALKVLWQKLKDSVAARCQDVPYQAEEAFRSGRLLLQFDYGDSYDYGNDYEGGSDDS